MANTSFENVDVFLNALTDALVKDGVKSARVNEILASASGHPDWLERAQTAVSLRSEFEAETIGRRQQRSAATDWVVQLLPMVTCVAMAIVLTLGLRPSGPSADEVKLIVASATDSTARQLYKEFKALELAATDGVWLEGEAASKLMAVQSEQTPQSATIVSKNTAAKVYAGQQGTVIPLPLDKDGNLDKDRWGRLYEKLAEIDRQVKSPAAVNVESVSRDLAEVYNESRIAAEGQGRSITATTVFSPIGSRMGGMKVEGRYGRATPGLQGSATAPH